MHSDAILLELKMNSAKLQGTKSNKQKSVAFLFTSNENFGKDSHKNNSSFNNFQKNKASRNRITQEAKNFSKFKSQKHGYKEVKEDLIKWKIIPCL